MIIKTCLHVMDEKTFIESLKHIAPSEGKLNAITGSKGFTEQMMASWFVDKKKTVEKESRYLLEGLLLKYDMTHTEIGLISFLDLPIYTGNYMQFGVCDQFRLVTDCLSGEVLMLDAEEDMVSLRCAGSEADFLRALIAAEEHFIRRMFNPDLLDDQYTICKDASGIAQTTGGVRYLDFYKHLLGCFE